MNATQTGSTALVVGQQSYDITFPIAFGAVPSFFSPTVEMPGDNGEVFEASYAELTALGVRVWLSGVPTSASLGGFIKWMALGENGVLPPVLTPGFTGITTIQLCNRIGRRGRGGDFTKLSLNGQQDIIEAANAALQRLYNALPTYFKEQTQGFVLPAPLAVVGVGVTQYAKAVTGITFTSAQFGQTVVLEGDPGWNQIIGEQELLNPYMGPTGTVGGIIYGNAIHSDTYPLDRIIGNPQFANQNLLPLTPLAMQSATNYGVPSWLWYQTVGIPCVWWPQVFGNSQGKKPIMVLRFAPAPQQAWAINVRMGFWPKRLTLDDYDNNSELPVPDQFVEPCLLPMALEEFQVSPEWQPANDGALITARGQAGEKYARNQLGQIGSPANQVMTPWGF